VWPLVNTYSAALFGRYLRGIDAYETTLATNLDPEVMTYEGVIYRGGGIGTGTITAQGAHFGLALP
jgi:hypothetical protein